MKSIICSKVFLVLGSLMILSSNQLVADSISAEVSTWKYVEANAGKVGTWPAPMGTQFIEGNFPARPMSLFFRGRIAANSVSLPPNPELERLPILVIVHGLKDHLDRYGDLIHELDKRRSQGEPLEVWAYDQSHHGRSGLAQVAPSQKPTGAVDSIKDNVANLAKFLQSLRDFRGLNRPIILLGHSMGGLVAATLAIDHRSSALISGIILSAPALMAFGGPIEGAKVSIIRALRELTPNLPAVPDFLSNRKFYWRPGMSRREAQIENEKIKTDPLVNHGLHTVRTAGELIRGIDELAETLASDEALKKLRIPFLIVHGENDEITNSLGSRDLFGRIVQNGDALAQKKTELHILKSLTFHDLPGHAPRTLAEIATTWINKVVSDGGGTQ